MRAGTGYRGLVAAVAAERLAELLLSARHRRWAMSRGGAEWGAGHYPAMRLGPPWWFHDSIEGMMRFRQQVTEAAGIYNTAGFNDDTRAFCSIPARHDLSRRVDANFLGRLVARHVIDLDDARAMARALAGELARDTYRLTPNPLT